jgi:hypothetical protein
MNKLVFFVFLSVFAAGCRVTPSKPAVVTINNYSISPEEFEMEFKSSPMSKKDTLEARKQFLETLINRKLMLQEAQKLGLDKQEDFLKTIERFWEQSLLKTFVDEKSKEVSRKVFITDGVIQQAYQNMIAAGKTEKSYAEMYPAIKWELTRAKEAQLMDKMIKDMRNKAVITEDLGLLKAN